MSIPKVTDLVQKSLNELAKAQSAPDVTLAARHERNASTFAELASAQSAKTANIISYLNSGRGQWSATDEAVVREMLGLPPLGGDGDGGVADDVILDEPQTPAPAVTAPEPAPAPEPAVSAHDPYEPPVEPALGRVTWDQSEIDEVDFAR